MPLRASMRSFRVGLPSCPRTLTSCHLSIELLEDRTLLAASVLDTSFGNNGIALPPLNIPVPIRVIDSVQTANGGIEILATLPRAQDTSIGADLAIVRLKADGTLDSTFGRAGQVAINRFGDDQGFEITVQADGKTLVLSCNFSSGTLDSGVTIVNRLNTDGSVDTSFGEQGALTLPNLRTWASPELLEHESHGLALQADGKILVTGVVIGADTSNEVGIYRLNVNGTFDLNFGLGGFKRLDFGGADEAVGLGVLDNGRIFIAADSIIDDGFEFFGYAWAVAKLNPDGSLDSSYGDGGFASLLMGESATLNALSLQSNGQVLLGGTTDSDFAVVRFTAAGFTDGAFGDAGLTTLSFDSDTQDVVSALAVQTDGKIVALGTSTDLFEMRHLAIARLSSSGQVDNTFSFDGRSWISDSNQSETYGTTVFLGATGSLTAVGGLNRNFDDFGPYRFLVAHMTSAGLLDASFGSGGLALGNYLVQDAWLSDGAIQADGKYVVVGGCIEDGPVSFVARFLADGSPDLTFGSGGAVSFVFGQYDDWSQIVVQPSGDIVVGGNFQNEVQNAAALVRLRPNGEFDFNFGGGTPVIVASDNWLQDLAVLADGRIVVTSIDWNASGNRIHRLMADGSPDLSFGSGISAETADFSITGDAGSLIVTPKPPFDAQYALQSLTTSTGQMIISALVREYDEFGNQIAGHHSAFRLTSTGNLDVSFGTQGSVTWSTRSIFDSPNRIVSLPNGDLVVAGSGPGPSNGDVWLTRLSSAGNLVSSFGSNGTAYVDFGQTDFFSTLVLQTDNKFLLVGSTGPFEGEEIDPPTQLALARLNASGTLDSTFGTGGVAKPIPASSNSVTAVSAFATASGVILPLSMATSLGFARVLTSQSPPPPPSDAPTIADLRVVLNGAKNLVTQFQLTASESLDASAGLAGNYTVFRAGKDKKFGTADDIQVTISANYNDALRRITLTPTVGLPLKELYRIQVLPNVKDLSGLALDGDGNGTGGDAFVGYVGRGSSLSYRDSNGDAVSISLSKGTLELLLGADGEGRRLLFFDTVTGKTTLSGTVTKSGSLADGYTTLREMELPAGVTNQLSSKFLLPTLPGAILKLTGTGFNLTKPVDVLFKDNRGYEITVRGRVVNSTSVEVAVPTYLSPLTGLIGEGSVSVSTRQTINGKQVQKLALPSLVIADLPQLPGVAPGSVTLQVLDTVIAYYSQLMTNYAKLGPASHGSIAIQPFLDLLQQESTLLSAQRQKIQDAANGEVLQVGQVGSQVLRLGSTELALLDRIIASGFIAGGIKAPTVNAFSALAVVTEDGSFLSQISNQVLNSFKSSAEASLPYIRQFSQRMGTVIGVAGLATGIILGAPEIAVGAAAVATAQLFATTTFAPLAITSTVTSVYNTAANVKTTLSSFKNQIQHFAEQYLDQLVEFAHNQVANYLAEDYPREIVDTAHLIYDELTPNLTDKIVSGFTGIKNYLTNPNSSPVPAVSASSSAVEFSYEPGGTVPTTQSITISNTGTAGSTLRYTTSTSASWITLSGSTSANLTTSGSGILKIGVNPAGLSPGSYHGTVQIVDPNANNSPLVIQVNLTVGQGPQDIIGSYTTSGTFAGTINGSSQQFSAAVSFQITETTVLSTGFAGLVGAIQISVFSPVGTNFSLEIVPNGSISQAYYDPNSKSVSIIVSDEATGRFFTFNGTLQGDRTLRGSFHVVFNYGEFSLPHDFAGGSNTVFSRLS